MRSRLGSRHASPHAIQRPSVNRGRGRPCKPPPEAHQSTHTARACRSAAHGGAAPHEAPQPAKAQRAKRVGNLHGDPPQHSRLRQLATGQRDGDQAAVRHRAAVQRTEQRRSVRLPVGTEAQGLDVPRNGHIGIARTAALRIHHVDPTRRPLPWRKPLCVDLASHPRMRREARLCGDRCRIRRVDTPQTAIRPAREKSQALYAIRSRPVRQPYRQPGKDTMTATPSVSKTTVSRRRPATPSVHLYRFLPSGSVFVPASGSHCFGVPTHCALFSDVEKDSPHGKAAR